MPQKKRWSENPVDDYIISHSAKLTPEQAGLQEASKDLPMGIMLSDPDQLAFIQNILRLIGAKKVLDVGVYTGYSCLSMALALPPGGKVIGCDISDEDVAVGRPFWKSAGIEDKIELRIAPASETLQKLIDDGEAGTFDFAFIDADKPNYDDYYEKCLVLLRSGGVIALDNMLWGGKVADPADNSQNSVVLRKLNDKIYNDERVRSNLLSLGDGTVFVFKP